MSTASRALVAIAFSTLSSLALVACSPDPPGLACVATVTTDAGDVVGLPLGSVCPNVGPGNKLSCQCTCGVFNLGSTTSFLTTLGSGKIDVCLPPDLVAGARANPQGAEARAIVSYCGSTVAPAMRDVARLRVGACGIAAGCLCNLVTQPNGVATVQNDLCDTDCPDVECVKRTCTNGVCTGNCGNPLGSDGTLHLERCMCSRATDPCSDDPAPLTSDKLCVPYAGQGDPPGVFGGLALEVMSARSTAVIDPAQSHLKVDASFDDSLGIHHSDSRTTNINGEFRVYGTAHADGSADLIVDFGMFPNDFTFHFFPPTDIAISQMAITGGTGTVPVHFAPGGLALLPAGSINLSIDFVRDGQRYRAVAIPPKAVLMRADLASRTFEIPSIGLSFDNVTGTINLVGTITNEPPVADAGADQVAECTSPSGATVTLSGSVTDPDDNVTRTVWTVGDQTISQSTTTTATAPLGSTSYTLSATDATLQMSEASTTVTVRDTTPPTLTLSASPGCLWPPNHSMVLYGLGAGLDAKAKDACDPAPDVRIVDVQSDQPANGGGSGNTPVDVRFGSGGFCIRAERSATDRARHYTVTVEAKDASGNTTTRTIPIVVPADMADGSNPSCAPTDPSRLVADDDPRCVADVGAKPAEPAAASVDRPATAAPPLAPSTADNGCSMSMRSSATPLQTWLLFAVALVLLNRRRIRHLLLAVALVSVGCSHDDNVDADAGVVITNAPLPTCVLGWFTDPVMDPCGFCGTASTPECATSDCRQVTFYGYVSGNVHYEGVVSYSATAHTMSTITPISQSTYTVTSSVLTINGRPLNATCSDTQLSLGGYIENRASPALSSALAGATANGQTTWSGYVIPQ